jgi:alpha-beta hydrolase superfamily lysophospholipase
MGHTGDEECMRADAFTLTDAGGEPIFVYRWLPEDPARAVVQIVHGMAEHAARYERFAQALTGAGFAVYADDHRGHGKTAGELSRVGILARQHGYRWLIADERMLTKQIRDEHPERKVFLFGHSMGTFMAQAVVALAGHEYAGMILSGAAVPGGALLRIARSLATAEALIRGRERQSPMLNTLTFGAYNQPFRPNRTDFDWLSRDPVEVDRYVGDPYCGGIFTAGFFADLFDGVLWTYRPAVMARIPKDLPVYMISGADDPVGGQGKGVMALADRYRALGMTDVTLKLYPGGRHEMHNEINRDEVAVDAIAWLDSHLA